MGRAQQRGAQQWAVSRGPRTCPVSFRVATSGWWVGSEQNWPGIGLKEDVRSDYRLSVGGWAVDIRGLQ